MIAAVAVGDVAEQVRGVTYKKAEASKSPAPGLVGVVRAGNIVDGELTLEDLVFVPQDRVSRKQMLCDGDVLIAASSGSIDVVGKAARVRGDQDVAFGGFCKVLRPRGRLDVGYFSHFFQTPAYRRYVSQVAAGANINNLKNSHLDDIEIPLPPIEEQRRISAILDAADVLRAKRRQSLAKLDTLAQAIFNDMFGDAASSASVAELLKDAELFVDGDWVETKDQDQSGTVRLTQLADVGVGSWLDRSRRFMTPEAAERLKCTYLRAGDVLIARMPDPIGRACVFPGDERPCVTAVDVCVVRPGTTLDPQWLVTALNSTGARRQIERLATGTTRSRVSRRNLGRVTLPLVPLDEQREFARRATAAERSIRRSNEHLSQFDTLLASLQQRAFAGEL